MFQGLGLSAPGSFHPPVAYQVAADKRAQAIYFRGGNSAPEMIYLVLTSSGRPMRFFPIGAKGAMHVPLAVLEDISPGSKVEVLCAAPEGVSVNVLLDIGFMEID
jgi:assimilatory nitrate reductase catalytic subunit